MIKWRLSAYIEKNYKNEKLIKNIIEPNLRI